jgi:hypothetical protein
MSETGGGKRQMQLNKVMGFFLVLALLSGSAFSSALAGVIRMQVSCSVRGTNMTVRMTNTGDEPAQNVRAHVTFMGKEMHTDNISSFPPQVPKSENFVLDTTDLKGTYPAVVIVDFEDLNSYPFSSVSIQQVRSGATSPADLMGVLQGQIELATKVSVPLRIRSKSDREIAVTCRVVAPNELLAEVPEFTLTIPPKGDEQATVELENFSGTPTSSYPVHVLLEYDQNGEHFCVPAVTMVTIVAPSPVSSMKFWVVLVVALAVLLGAPIVAVLMSRRHPHQTGGKS